MTEPTTWIVRDPRFREHEGGPGHPERPARLEAIDRALAERPELALQMAPRPATEEELLCAHSEPYLAQLRALEGRAVQLDADTYLSPRSLEVARLAVGSAVELGSHIARGDARSGFALVRPPGHHAERSHAMGFCVFNQVAIVARQLQLREGLERIAIIDWDVHHGNGTQHAFEDDRDTLFVSTHQFPFYPGTGALAERGVGAGEGTTLNLPLPAGSGDAEYCAAFSEVVLPALEEFRPQMLLVSAGFDAHVQDPLGGMRVSTETYRSLTASLRELADAQCDGRILCLLEGGYAVDALAESVVAVLEELALPQVRSLPRPDSTPLAQRLVGAYREAHGPYWRSLRNVARV